MTNKQIFRTVALVAITLSSINCEKLYAARDVFGPPIHWENWILVSGANAVPGSRYQVKTSLTLDNPSTIDQVVTVTVKTRDFLMNSSGNCGEYKFNIQGNAEELAANGASQSFVVTVSAGESKIVSIRAIYRAFASGINPACAGFSPAAPLPYHVNGSFSIKLSVDSANDAGFLTGMVYTTPDDSLYTLVDSQWFLKNAPIAVPINGGRPF